MVECDVKDCRNSADIVHADNVYCAKCYIQIMGWILPKRKTAQMGDGAIRKGSPIFCA